MIKYLIAYLIALLLFALPCLAGMGIGGFPYPGPGVVDIVASTWTCDDADIFCEGFEGFTDCGNDAAGATNCNYTYTSSEPTGTSVVFSSPSGPGGQDGSYVLSVDDSSSSLSGNNTKYTFVSNIGTFYKQFYFKANRPAATSSGATIVQLYNDAGFSTGLIDVSFEYVSVGNYKIQFVHRNSSVSSITTTSNLTNLTLDTWYGIRIFYSASQPSGGVSFAIDYDLDGTFTPQTIADTSTSSRSLRCMMFQNGTTTASVGANFKTYFDMIKINTSSFPAVTVP